MDGEGSDDDKNKEADEMYNLGIQAWNEKDYELARDKFTEAYNHCTSGYVNEKTFEDDIKVAECIIYSLEGSALYQKGKFVEALKKYQEAVDTGASDELVAMNKCVMAYCFKELGKQCSNQKKFIKAKEYYNKAHQLLIECYEIDQIYEKEMKVAESRTHNIVGNHLLYQRKYAQAMNKYLQAIEICPKDKTETINGYKRNMALCCKKRTQC